MSESTNFMVKNIEDTHEIVKAIPLMEEEVFARIDAAIRDAYEEWLGDDWRVDDDIKLQSDNEIAVTRPEFLFVNEEGEPDAYLWLTLRVKGDDAIWGFFGLPTQNEPDGAYVILWLNTDIFSDRKVAIQAIDSLMKQKLER